MIGFIKKDLKLKTKETPATKKTANGFAFTVFYYKLKVCYLLYLSSSLHEYILRSSAPTFSSW